MTVQPNFREQRWLSSLLPKWRLFSPITIHGSCGCAASLGCSRRRDHHMIQVVFRPSTRQPNVRGKQPTWQNLPFVTRIEKYVTVHLLAEEESYDFLFIWVLLFLMKVTLSIQKKISVSLWWKFLLISTPVAITRSVMGRKAHSSNLSKTCIVPSRSRVDLTLLCLG